MSLTSFEKIFAVHKEVEGVLLGQFDSLSNDVVEMIGSEIVGDEVPVEFVKFRPNAMRVSKLT